MIGLYRHSADSITRDAQPVIVVLARSKVRACPVKPRRIVSQVPLQRFYSLLILIPDYRFIPSIVRQHEKHEAYE